MAASDPTALLADACCLSCLTDRQLLIIQTQLLFQQSGGTSPMTLDQAQALLDDAGCLECLTQFQLLLIQTQLLNDIAAGGGAVNCVICDVVDPVAAPTGCSCALHVNTVAASLWYWDGASWTQLIGP